MTAPRLTLSDAYRDLLEIHGLALTRPARSASEDVEIIENAKHEHQVKISASRQDGETLQDTADRAWEVFKATRAKIEAEYGMPTRDDRNGDPEKVARKAASTAAAIARRSA